MNLTSRLVATLHHLRNRATTENLVPAPPVSLAQKNDSGSTPSPIRWLGADVIISEQPVHGNVSNHCDAIVVTQHARALAWLYTFLRYESGNALNYLNESEFYTETSRAVNDLLRQNPNASQSEVLIAALDGALEIVQEWLEREVEIFQLCYKTSNISNVIDRKGDNHETTQKTVQQSVINNFGHALLRLCG